MSKPGPSTSEFADQYAPENVAYPDDWTEIVNTMFTRTAWSLTEAANLLCGFRPDRHNLSINPENPEPDPMSGGFEHRPWELNDDELRYWRYLGAAQTAANQGILSTAAPETRASERDAVMVDASQRPILPAEQRVAPQVFMVWAHRHLENFPEELKAFYPTPSDSELNPQEQIRVLKRELSYAAVRERNLVALIVLLINFPDHLKRGKTLGMARLLRARDKVCKALGKDKLGFQNQDNLFSRAPIDKMLSPGKKHFSKAAASRAL